MITTTIKLRKMTYWDVLDMRPNSVSMNVKLGNAVQGIVNSGFDMNNMVIGISITGDTPLVYMYQGTRKDGYTFVSDNAIHNLYDIVTRRTVVVKSVVLNKTVDDKITLTVAWDDNEFAKVCGVDLGFSTAYTVSVGMSDTTSLVPAKTEAEIYRSAVETALHKDKNAEVDRAKWRELRNELNIMYARDIVDFAVTNKCNCIQLERLDGVTSDTELQHIAVDDFQHKIEQYADLVDVKVIYVNPYCTSLRCSECGYVNKANRVTQDVFFCHRCQYSENADVNASQNLAIPNIDYKISTGMSGLVNVK